MPLAGRKLPGREARPRFDVAYLVYAIYMFSTASMQRFFMPRPELYPVKKIVGFDQAMIDDVERWRAKQRPIPNVSEAIRQLVGHALLSTKAGGRRSVAASDDASLMAGRAIDRLADRSAPGKEQASRKKRLLQGPKEFREMRAKAQKPKAF
jgi:hypothetical protein